MAVTPISYFWYSKSSTDSRGCRPWRYRQTDRNICILADKIWFSVLKNVNARRQKNAKFLFFKPHNFCKVWPLLSLAQCSNVQADSHVRLFKYTGTWETKFVSVIRVLIWYKSSMPHLIFWPFYVINAVSLWYFSNNIRIEKVWS